MLVRRRPGTASGVIFATLEDETGIANVVIWSRMFERYRRVVLAARLMGVAGRLQREGIVTHLVAERLVDLTEHLASLRAGTQPMQPPLARADAVKRPGQDARNRAVARREAELRRRRTRGQRGRFPLARLPLSEAIGGAARRPGHVGVRPGTRATVEHGRATLPVRIIRIRSLSLASLQPPEDHGASPPRGGSWHRRGRLQASQGTIAKSRGDAMTRNPLPDGVVHLDELDILVLVDNETDTLSSVDEGVPQIPEIVHLAARTAPSRQHEGHECKIVFDQLCCACHGLSVLLTGRRGGEKRSLLFDVGPYPDLWLDNARRLGVDLAAIECIFLSHWHFDHSGGFPEVVAAIGKARSVAGLPRPIVDLHPDRPDQRGVLLPSGVMLMLPQEPTIEDIARSGGETVTHDDPHPVCGGFFFGSGAIDRVTSYETGLAGHHSFRGESGSPDPLIMDERFVAASLPGRGVTLLSACSHAGIVNACLAAKTYFPEAPIDLVLGGYHLSGKAMEPRIEPTVRDLQARIDPRLVAPGHCTGWRAKAKLANGFAPGRYAPSVVGALYRLKAGRI